MVRVRLFLAWLLLFALPLQGFAAAGMVSCGQVRQTAQVAASHDHGSQHGHAHGQAASQPGDPAQVHPPASAGTDTAHSCGLCAAHCHAIGLTVDLAMAALAAAPRIAPDQPFLRIDSRPAPVPDKPPRA